MPTNNKDDRKPRTTYTHELFDHIRQLSLSDEEKSKLTHMVGSAFSRQRNIMEQSKQEAIQVVQRGNLNAIERLEKQVLAIEASRSEISKYFENTVADLRAKLQIESKTNLLRFEHFEERLETFLRMEKRGDRCALGLVDVADFKDINDTFGHSVGDKVLAKIAELLKSHARLDDWIAKERRQEPRPGFHGRRGGDEFVFFSPDIRTCRTARVISERFVYAVQQYALEEIDERLKGIIISVDVGVVCFDPTLERSDQETARKMVSGLTDLADTFMYKAKTRAKRARRSRVRHHVWLDHIKISGGRLVSAEEEHREKGQPDLFGSQ